MDREFIIPVCFIISVVQVKSVVVNSFIVPVTHLVEDVHVFSDDVSVDHVEVKNLVLLGPAFPGRAPVIVFGHGNHALDRHVGGLYTAHAEALHF